MKFEGKKVQTCLMALLLLVGMVVVMPTAFSADASTSVSIDGDKITEAYGEGATAQADSKLTYNDGTIIESHAKAADGVNSPNPNPGGNNGGNNGGNKGGNHGKNNCPCGCNGGNGNNPNPNPGPNPGPNPNPTPATGTATSWSQVLVDGVIVTQSEGNGASSSANSALTFADKSKIAAETAADGTNNVAKGQFFDKDQNLVTESGSSATGANSVTIASATVDDVTAKAGSQNSDGTVNPTVKAETASSATGTDGKSSTSGKGDTSESYSKVNNADGSTGESKSTADGSTAKANSQYTTSAYTVESSGAGTGSGSYAESSAKGTEASAANN